MKKIKELYIKYKEVINYLIFGGLTTIVNFVSYFIVARVLKIDEVASSAISWFCSVLFACIPDIFSLSVELLVRHLILFFLTITRMKFNLNNTILLLDFTRVYISSVSTIEEVVQGDFSNYTEFPLLLLL